MPRGAGVDQFVDAVPQGERRAGDERAESRDQRPEVGFPPVPQRMLIIGRTAAAPLGNEQGQVVGAGDCQEFLMIACRLAAVRASPQASAAVSGAIKSQL